MLKRFEETAAWWEEADALQASTMLPDTVDDWTPLVTRAERNLAASSGEAISAPTHKLMVGMTLHRAGDSAGAITWFERVRSTDEVDAYANARCLLGLALAHCQLEQWDEARECLSVADQLVEQEFPKPEDSDLGRGWHNWLRCHILHREAEALIEPTGPTRDAGSERGG